MKGNGKLSHDTKKLIGQFAKSLDLTDVKSKEMVLKSLNLNEVYSSFVQMPQTQGQGQEREMVMERFEEKLDIEEKVLSKDGLDTRTRVENTKVLPYSAIGLLVMTFGEKSYIGTGAVIGKNVILTAAHNLYDANEGIEASTVTFLGGYNDGEVSCKAKHKSLFYHENYVKSKGAEDDYGLVILDKNVSDTTGLMEMRILSPEHYAKLQVNVCGYPGDKKGKNNLPNLYESYGVAKEADDKLIKYMIDTFCGQSGCPVLFKDKDKMCISAVHIGGDVKVNRNWATPLTEKRVSQILTWLNMAKNFEGMNIALGLNGTADRITSLAQYQKVLKEIKRKASPDVKEHFEAQASTNESFFSFLSAVPWKAIGSYALNVGGQILGDVASSLVGKKECALANIVMEKEKSEGKPKPIKKEEEDSSSSVSEDEDSEKSDTEKKGEKRSKPEKSTDKKEKKAEDKKAAHKKKKDE